jgi:hypothetical protein
MELGNLRAAGAHLEAAVTQGGEPVRHQATLLLQQLRRRVH